MLLTGTAVVNFGFTNAGAGLSPGGHAHLFFILQPVSPVPTGTISVAWYGGPTIATIPLTSNGSYATAETDISISATQPGTLITTNTNAGDCILYFSYSGDATYAPAGGFDSTKYAAVQNRDLTGDGYTFFPINFADHVAVTQSPTKTAVGDPISPVKVSVLTSVTPYNTPPVTTDTTATDAITASIASTSTGSGTLSGATTENAVSGIATFSDLSINQPGQYSLTFTDANGTLATTVPFQVGGSGGSSATGLTPTITRAAIPLSVISGSAIRGTVSLSVNNAGSALDSGFNTIAIYASTNNIIDGSSVFLGRARPFLKVTPGGTQKNVTVPISAASVPAGNYTLLAQDTDASSNVITSAPGFALTVAAAFTAFSETVTLINLPARVVSGTPSRAMAKVVITNHGNVAAKGTTTITISASPTMDVAGIAINSLPRFLNIRANGGTAAVLVPFKALPALADNDYFIVASVTDPLGGTSVASSAATTNIAASFVTLGLAFGNLPRTVLNAGAPLIITNSGNVDDTSTFTATIGFATDAAGSNIVGTTAGTLLPTKVTVRAGKTAAIHVTGWKNLVTAGTHFLTVTLTDANGNTATAVSSGAV